MHGHFVSKSAGGVCDIDGCCGISTHKIGEEIPWDEPLEEGVVGDIDRHNFTAYVCCRCFRKIFGTVVFCER